MKTITFTCETITPMFLAGADGTTPELRAPSIKGALRFWWRAMNGHLPLAELKQRETEIFGGTERRSKFIIQVPNKELQFSEVKLVPHHHKSFKPPAFKIGQTFTVHLGVADNQNFNAEQLKALFILVCTLGGFGKRTRRGMGSIRLKEIDKVAFSCTTLKEIFNHLEKINKGKFRLDQEGLILSNFGQPENYPYIKQIQLGSRTVDLMKISTATHDFKGTKNYEPSLGYAGKDGRFASPIYASMILVGNELRPIITTLNAVPDKGHPDPKLQEEFRNAILL